MIQKDCQLPTKLKLHYGCTDRAGWKKVLAGEFKKPYFLQIVHFLKTEKNNGKMILSSGKPDF